MSSPIDPSTANDLLQKIMTSPSGSDRSQHSWKQSTNAVSFKSSQMHDPILHTLWLDEDNIFWDSSKRSYLNPHTRAMAQEAVAEALKRRSGVLAPPPTSSSSPAKILLDILTHGASSLESKSVDTIFHPRTPSRTDSFVSSSAASFRFTTNSSSTMSRTSCASDEDEIVKSRLHDRDHRRQSLLESLLDHGHAVEASSEGGNSFAEIRAPRPRRLHTIPFLHQAESTRNFRTAQQHRQLRTRVAPPSAIDMSLVREYTRYQRLHSQPYEIIADNSQASPQISEDDGFDGDNEGSDMMDDESEAEDGPFEIIELTPRERPSFTPPTPALHAIPLPPVSPIPTNTNSWIRDETAFGIRSDVTTLDYPETPIDEAMALLSPLQHLGHCELRERPNSNGSW